MSGFGRWGIWYLGRELSAPFLIWALNLVKEIWGDLKGLGQMFAILEVYGELWGENNLGGANPPYYSKGGNY